MTQHPLDPLSAEEIRRAVSIVRREKAVDARWRFGIIELKEPSKQSLHSFARGKAVPREAIATCWSRDEGLTFKATVSIGDDAVVSWEPRPGEQANFTVDEYHDCDEALRKDPRVVDALRRHGAEDMDRVLLDTWCYGGLMVPEAHRGRRVGWTDVWYRDSQDSNPYAHPVSGLHFVVDVNTLELLEVQESPAVPRPRAMGEYVPRLVPDLTLREDLAPLQIVQPEGVSFTLDGHLLQWQRWSMRLGFNPREGLVISTLGYEDGGRCARWPTGCRSRRWSSPTATRGPTTRRARRSTSASGGSAS